MKLIIFIIGILLTISGILVIDPLNMHPTMLIIIGGIIGIFAGIVAIVLCEDL